MGERWVGAKSERALRVDRIVGACGCQEVYWFELNTRSRRLIQTSTVRKLLLFNTIVISDSNCTYSCGTVLCSRNSHWDGH